MFYISLANLLHDKSRLAISLIGVAFSITLMLFNSALYLGAVRDGVNLIDNSKADLWIIQEGYSDIYRLSLFPDGKLAKVKRVNGVKEAAGVLFIPGLVTKSGNTKEDVRIVGYQLNKPDLGGPWQIKSVAKNSLGEGMVITDLSLARKLKKKLKVGQTLEINNQDVKVEGFAEDAKLWAQPYVFVPVTTAQKLSLNEGKLSYILVKVKPGYRLAAVRHRLEKIGGIDVYTAGEIRQKTIDFWNFKTGMGMTVAMMALGGFLVGLMVIGISTYTSTVERTKEFGTLKAIGSSNYYLYQIVFGHSLIVGFLGYLFALGLTAFLGWGLTRFAGLSFMLNSWLLALVLFLVIFMASLGSFFPIRRITRGDPFIIFRG